MNPISAKMPRNDVNNFIGSSVLNETSKSHQFRKVMRAELGVGFQAVSENYVSEVTCDFPYRIKVKIKKILNVMVLTKLSRQLRLIRTSLNH
jgi:ribosome-associated toxin RatA of RatAB toxin-antitoxin module